MLIAKSGFDGASPTRVAFVDARDERLASLRFSRQGLLEHLHDVARRQQLQARLLGHALFRYEQHRQHHHRDVVMPWPPSQRLIIGEAALAFGVFESALDPVALPCIWASRSRGVSAEAFERLYLIVLTDPTSLPDDQMPASRSLFLAVPDPDDPAGRNAFELDAASASRPHFQPRRRYCKALNGASFNSTEDLTKAIDEFCEVWHENAHPFVWKKREVRGSQIRNTIHPRGTKAQRRLENVRVSHPSKVTRVADLPNPENLRLRILPTQISDEPFSGVTPFPWSRKLDQRL